MIIKGLFELVYTLLSVVLTPFQIVPDMPQALQNVLTRFLDLIFDPIHIVLYFVDVNVVKAIIPLVVIVANMEKIWNGILWILKKLPFVGVE